MTAAQPVIRDLPTTLGPARATIFRPPHTVGTLVLSHGAGGGIGAVDLQVIAEVGPRLGYAVALVEQPWRVAGKKVAPRPPVLDVAWLELVPQLMTGRGKLPGPLIVGGRSAGARVAARTGAALGAAATMLLSFPLSPPVAPGKTRVSRADELALAVTPIVALQGTTDPYATPTALSEVLPAGSLCLGVTGAHSFAVKVKAELTAAVERLLEALPRG